MKRFARYICLILVFLLIIAVPVYAVEGRSMDASYYFSYTNAYLSKISDTTFRVTYQANGTGVMDEIGVSYMEIQKSSDNSDWDTVATYSNLIGYNTGSHLSSFVYTGTANNYYRAYVEFYAKDDTGRGYYDYYTASIRVP